jgi:hypothetical protein
MRAMTAALPPLVQDSGLPFDLFIQALTEQLDRAQAAMAIKARVAKLPMTFAVKDISLDLRAFVSVVDDDLYLRPAGPGDSEASTLKLSLTTITRPMIEENALDFRAGEPKLNLRDALGDTLSEQDRRKLELIGINTVQQLNELKRAAGADVIARLSRLPMNRLQQALVRASAPHVTHVEARVAPVPVASVPPMPWMQQRPGVAIDTLAPARGTDGTAVAVPRSSDAPAFGGRIADVAIAPALTPPRAHLSGANLIQHGRLPQLRVAGRDVPLVMAQEHELVAEPHPSQFGEEAELDFGDGTVLKVKLPAAPIPEEARR